MAKRIDPEVAVAAMLELGFQPLEPYPGANNRWLVICGNCKSQAMVTYTAVVSGGQIGCRNCASALIAAAKRMSDLRLKDLLESLGVINLGTYRNSKTPLTLECRLCNFEWKTSLNKLQTGQGCPKCLAVKKGVNFEPLIAGRISVSRANEIAQKLGLESLEDYPQSASKQWRVRCLSCGHVQVRTLTAIKRSNGCVACSKSLAVKQLRTSQEEARKIALSAEYMPLEDYVSQNTPWRCQCTRCGRISTPRLGNILQGNSCAYCAGKCQHGATRAHPVEYRAHR